MQDTLNKISASHLWLDPGYFKTEKIYYLHIVPEEVAPVFVFQLFTRQQWKHKVFWCPE